MELEERLQIGDDVLIHKFVLGRVIDFIGEGWVLVEHQGKKDYFKFEHLTKAPQSLQYFIEEEHECGNC